MYLKLTSFSLALDLWYHQTPQSDPHHPLNFPHPQERSNLVGKGYRAFSVVNFAIVIAFSLVPADRCIRQFVVGWRPEIVKLK